MLSREKWEVIKRINGIQTGLMDIVLMMLNVEKKDRYYSSPEKDAKEFLEEQRISYMVNIPDHLSAPIYWQDAEASTMLNSASAIWTRPKSEITEEQYNSFYQQASSAYDTPYLTMHNVTEGVTNFTSLLFIPSTRPMDLFNPERKSHCNFTLIVFSLQTNVKNWFQIGFDLFVGWLIHLTLI